LNQPGIFDEIVLYFRSILEDLPDKRIGKNKHYQMSDAALSAFSVFFTQSPSFLAHQKSMAQKKAEVLSSIIQGKDNKAIAAQMNINISTVRKHLENIYRKLGVKNRTEAIASALEKLGCLNSSPLI
jgi:DNA-binding NarL/FixJ family response regulator